MIEALAVSRQFGDNVVVSGLDLSIDTGEVHALLGPNGAGKTTVLRMLAGLTAPSSGSVKVLGADPFDRSVRSQIGWIPSGDRSFYLRLSGKENLIFFARLYGMPLRAARARAAEVLEFVDLVEAADQPARIYSHGMQKRLGVARGLLREPRVLIVDEATHDLDPVGAQTVRDLAAAAAKQGTAVVWATQRLDEIRSFAHTVTVLGRGDVRFSGPVEELSRRALTRTYEVKLTDGSFSLDGLGQALAGLGEVSAHPFHDDRFLMHMKSGVALSDAFDGLGRMGHRVMSCSEARSDVEEAFLYLTSGSGHD